MNSINEILNTLPDNVKFLIVFGGVGLITLIVFIYWVYIMSELIRKDCE